MLKQATQTSYINEHFMVDKSPRNALNYWNINAKKVKSKRKLDL